MFAFFECVEALLASQIQNRETLMLCLNQAQKSWVHWERQYCLKSIGFLERMATAWQKVHPGQTEEKEKIEAWIARKEADLKVYLRDIHTASAVPLPLQDWLNQLTILSMQEKSIREKRRRANRDRHRSEVSMQAGDIVPF